MLEKKTVGYNYPPLHPRCRVAVCPFIEGASRTGTRIAKVSGKYIDVPANMKYKDFEKVYIKKEISFEQWQKNNLNKPTTDDKTKLIKDCKTFTDLQNFWDKNYNVKVATQIGKLHIESVQKAMYGVEIVINEFPTAGKFLKEFDLGTFGVMAATYKGNIKFNAGYFNDVKNLQGLIMGNTTGYHPKNTGIIETGSQEM